MLTGTSSAWIGSSRVVPGDATAGSSSVDFGGELTRHRAFFIAGDFDVVDMTSIPAMVRKTAWPECLPSSQSSYGE